MDNSKKRAVAPGPEPSPCAAGPAAAGPAAHGRIRAAAASRVRGFLGAWRTALRISAISFRARTQYRGDFITALAMGLAWQTSILVFATVLLTRFPGLGGWTSGGVLLIVAIRMLSHGGMVLVFNSLIMIPYIVQQGALDGYLIRPMPVYRQILLYTFPLNALGDSFSALLLFAFAITRVHLSWTPLMALYLVAAVIGGVLLEAAIQTLVSILAFRFTIPMAVFMWFDRMIATFGNYPFSILPLAARAVLTYLLPVAFVAYLPAAVLTGRVASTGVQEWLAYASPAAGPLLYILARYAWFRALRHYESVGG
jgi:ABC-2 type transport system permease protein